VQYPEEGVDVLVMVNYLAVDERGDGHVPRSVGDHDEAEEGPQAVVPERRDEHRRHAHSAEDERPCSLVNVVIEQENVAAEREGKKVS
jgi:hypothetical protein